MLATTVQAIPFHTFKEKVSITRQEERKGNRVTILDNIIYIESKDKFIDGHVEERKSLDKLPTSLSTNQNNM